MRKSAIAAAVVTPVNSLRTAQLGALRVHGPTFDRLGCACEWHRTDALL